MFNHTPIVQKNKLKTRSKSRYTGPRAFTQLTANRLWDNGPLGTNIQKASRHLLVVILHLFMVILGLLVVVLCLFVVIWPLTPWAQQAYSAIQFNVYTTVAIVEPIVIEELQSTVNNIL